tara:strand:- start:584 stop:838 length:255 start_codon:yes stop_codon:yes gene_type:complete
VSFISVPFTLYSSHVGILILPLSLIVDELFCNNFPVVESYLAIALSVDEAGQVISQAQSVPFSANTAQYVAFVGRFQVEASIHR